ncbi:MAG: RNA polymerase sigma factor [Sandaracinaceae bacterium]
MAHEGTRTDEQHEVSGDRLVAFGAGPGVVSPEAQPAGRTASARAKADRLSDLELARLCVEGDTAAQRTLFRLHRDRVHFVLYRILGSNHEIEDLVQDAFLAVFRSLRIFRGEATLGTWVDRITTRTAYRYLARRPRPTVHLEAVPPMPDERTDTARRVYLREVARRLYGYLARMPAHYRIPYALHVIDGRPMREVAEMTEASLTATKNRVWRARRRIEQRAKVDPLLGEFISPSSRRRT